MKVITSYFNDYVISFYSFGFVCETNGYVLQVVIKYTGYVTNIYISVISHELKYTIVGKSQATFRPVSSL
jgi:hypothetical protein